MTKPGSRSTNTNPKDLLKGQYIGMDSDPFQTEQDVEDLKQIVDRERLKIASPSTK